MDVCRIVQVCADHEAQVHSESVGGCCYSDQDLAL